MQGENIGAGNVDMAGQPISQAILKQDVTISLTRSPSDGMNWNAIALNLGKRNKEDWLGFGRGKMVFTGCNVVETFNTGTISYEMNFVLEQCFHYRQYVGKVGDFIPTTPDSDGISRASNVFLIQPFPETAYAWTGSTSLITSDEEDLLEGKVS